MEAQLKRGSLSSSGGTTMAVSHFKASFSKTAPQIRNCPPSRMARWYNSRTGLPFLSHSKDLFALFGTFQARFYKKCLGTPFSHYRIHNQSPVSMSQSVSHWRSSAVRSKRSSIEDLVFIRTKLLKWSSFCPHFTQSLQFPLFLNFPINNLPFALQPDELMYIICNVVNMRFLRSFGVMVEITT